MEMKHVRVGLYTFKVRPEEFRSYMAANPDAVVVGSSTAAVAPTPDVRGGVVSSASVSHSDIEIDHFNAIVERYPELTEAQVRAIIAAGFTLRTMPLDEAGLIAIKGIGQATAKRIVEASS